MSVRNAGATIREARLKNGLSQEQLADGICSALSISRIENNLAGVSPSTFQALMDKCGVFCELMPAFANRCDFDCFYSLKKARCYVENWQFDEAIKELTKVEEWKWADNKLYYQEWFLYTYYINSKLNGRSYKDEVLDTLKISRTQIDFDNIVEYFFSTVELELLIALSDEYLKLSDLDAAKHMVEQLTRYINNLKITNSEKNYYDVKLQVVTIKLLIQGKKYEEALKCCDDSINKAIHNNHIHFLYELNFLEALVYYYQNDSDKCLTHFKYTFYSSYAIGSYYSEYIRNYFRCILSYDLPNEIMDLTIPEINSTEYVWNSGIVPEGDGTYDFFSEGVLYIGTLIKELRTERHISATKLCKGLCTNSKLSKIESLELQPGIELTKALLQRLGVSDRIFVFWGDSSEFDMDEIKTRMVACKDPGEIQEIIQQTYLSIDKKDVINQQFFLLNIALTEEDNQKSLDTLQQALALTVPDFNIGNITSYRLTYNELSILNNIARAYADSSSPYMSLVYYNQLLEYFKVNDYDDVLKRALLSITVCGFSRALFRQRHNEEIQNLLEYTKQNFMRTNITLLASFYFFYCQALCCDEKESEAVFFARLACQINCLVGFGINAEALEKYLLEEYGITL